MSIVTIEDKLDLFRKVVLDELEAVYKERVEALDKENETQMTEFEKIIIQKSNDYVKSLSDQADYERKMMISQAKAKVKQMVLQKRQMIVEGLLEAIRKEAWNFTLSESYGPYLVSRFEINQDELRRFKTLIVSLDTDVFEESKAVLRPALLQAGFKEENIVFEEAVEDLIGGVKFYNEDKTIRVDESFASLIEDHKKRIGQYVYDMIQEAGGAHE